jgi:hypothetical protein
MPTKQWFPTGISGGPQESVPTWRVDDKGNATFDGIVKVKGLSLTDGGTTGTTMDNNEFLSGLTTGNEIKRLIGVNSSNAVAIDSDALGVTMAGSLSLVSGDILAGSDNTQNVGLAGARYLLNSVLVSRGVNDVTSNIAIGPTALAGAVTGANNIGIGQAALNANTSGAGNTAVGINSGKLVSTVSNGIFLGAHAGEYATAAGEFYLNSIDRTNTAGDKSSSLMWGELNATVASQTLTINAAITTTNATVFNEGGGDYNFRIETDGNANAFNIDAGLFSGIGSVNFGTAATHYSFFRVQNPAMTLVASADFAIGQCGGGGSVTVPSGTTGWVSTLKLSEPNLVATGTVTSAQVLLIDGAPSEGTDNYGINCSANMNNNFGGGAILAQNATTGFIFIPRLDTGAPSGTPAAIAAGNVAMCYDVTNNTLEVYNGSGWRTISTA